jgi:hypothetical protein
MLRQPCRDIGGRFVAGRNLVRRIFVSLDTDLCDMRELERRSVRAAG